MADFGQTAGMIANILKGIEQNKLRKEDIEYEREQRKRQEELAKMNLDAARIKHESEYYKPDYAPMMAENQDALKNASAGALTAAMAAGGILGMTGTPTRTPQLMPKQQGGKEQWQSLDPATSGEQKPTNLLSGMMGTLSQASAETPAFTGQMLKRDIPLSMDMRNELAYEKANQAQRENEMKRNQSFALAEMKTQNELDKIKQRAETQQDLMREKWNLASQFGFGMPGMKRIGDGSSDDKESSGHAKAMLDLTQKARQEAIRMKETDFDNKLPDVDTLTEQYVKRDKSFVDAMFPSITKRNAELAKAKEARSSINVQKMIDKIDSLAKNVESAKKTDQTNAIEATAPSKEAPVEELVNRLAANNEQPPINKADPREALLLKSGKPAREIFIELMKIRQGDKVTTVPVTIQPQNKMTENLIPIPFGNKGF